MKKIKVLALCAIVAGVITSCQKDEITNDAQPEALELSKDLQDKMLAAGVNPSNAFIKDMVNPLTGDSDQMVVSGDITMFLNTLESDGYALGDTEDGNKQYRTNNLVSSGNRTIDILGFTGSCCALSSRMQTGLQWAVNNYNRINTTLNFRLTFGTNFQAADMVVYDNGQGGQGGSAGFPEGGRPFKFIQILSGMANASNNVNEHVIGHEIGHALGFRHTDYARRRCGGANEGTAGVGAINIPGTPSANQWGQSGLDSGSLMISCFDGSEDGEFSNFDIVALEFLY
ncbi:hypothetical protein GCM10009430_30540 [Aquimarina litoralis]|uniref:Dual-action HEIGH metallo-peptidase n=1 Tax=Aquimarina litoralis TaxID=584605 RepID=A0ABP3U9E6_9FLAO